MLRLIKPRHLGGSPKDIILLLRTMTIALLAGITATSSQSLSIDEAHSRSGLRPALQFALVLLP
jgi:hypothetical protein